jgi:hypothetical protein
MRDTSDPRDAAGGNRRLVRLARAAGWVSFTAAAGILVYLGRLWLWPGALDSLLVEAVPGVQAPPPAVFRGVSAVLIAVPAVLLAVLLFEIGRLFRLFGAGQIFDPRVPDRLGRLGWLALAGTGAGLAVRPLVTVAMTMGNPPGAHQITLGISGENLIGLILGFLFLVLSLVMREALRLAEENASFV